MKIEKLIISTSAKEKLLKMALALFPEYSKITLGRNGMVKFFRRGIFKLYPQAKIHFSDLCLADIPRRMSMSRYGNTDLTRQYFKEITVRLRPGSLNYVVDYLWEEFMKVRVIDTMFDLNSMIVPFPNGTLVRQLMSDPRIAPERITEYSEDIMKLQTINTSNSIIKMDERRTIPLIQEVIMDVKVHVASLLIFFFLNLGQLMASMEKVTEIFPNSDVHAFLS